MRNLWLLSIIAALSGCAVTQPPIDFERTVIENENEAYNVVTRTLLAQSMAKTLADTCPTVAVSDEAIGRYDQAMNETLMAWFEQDPSNKSRLEARLGSVDGDEVSLGAGVMVDVAGNVTGYYIPRGFSALTPDGACATAAKEMESGSFIGKFLIEESTSDPLLTE